MRLHPLLHMAAACAAALACLPAQAQGAVKPIDARIVNTPGQPVPTTPVTPPDNVNAYCTFSSRLAPAATPISAGPSVSGEMQCSGTFTKLDVQRVIVHQSGANVVHYQALLTLLQDSMKHVGSFGSANPDVQLARSVRVTKADDAFIVDHVCSSGIAGVNATCGVTVILVGTPVTN